MAPASRGRRQTLGAVNANSRRRDSLDHGNSKIPLPPSSSTQNNGGGGGTRRPRKGRVSMIPRVQGGRENMIPPSPGVMAPTASSSRRKSVHGGGGRRQTMDAPSPMRHGLPPSNNNGVRQDPRPTHDKAFQQECIKKLLNYLLQNGYEYPISQKTLMRPSGRDFTNIVTFMLRQVDPLFQEHSTGGSSKDGNTIMMKLEDEVAMNFKALGYPFTISKTALVAAGSPHTWPTLLAALAWLMELLEILQEDTNDEVDIQEAKPFATLDELEMTTDKVFFTYMGKAYTAFLQGDEEMQVQLENSLADRFEQDDGFIEQEIERVTDLNAAMVEKMNTMIEESRELPQLIKKRDDYTTDLEQFRDLIRQMDDHIAALQQKVKERTEELGSTNKKLEKRTAHTDGLKQTLEKQAVSLGDIQKIQSELKGVEEALDRASALKEKLRASNWDGEEQLAAYFTELEGLVSLFNGVISELVLLPSMDDNVASLKITLDKSKALEKDQSLLLGVDLESVVHPCLVQYNDTYITNTAEASAKYQTTLDNLEDSKEKLKDYAENLRMLEVRKHKLEETLENERNTQDAKLTVRLREVEAIEASVASINDPVALEEQLVRYERQCAELEATKLSQQEENLANKQAVEAEIEAACKAIMELDMFCKAKTAEVNQYWLMKKTKMGTVQSSLTNKEESRE